MTATEGHVPFTYQGETFQTYYKIVGDLDNRTRTPVVVVHGGPGLAHDYLIPHTDLSNYSFPVLFYDQIGNARSTHLSEGQASLLSIEFFIEELVNLLEHFGVQHDYHIVGHSWGGMLAGELVVRRRAMGLKRLVVADAPSDMVLWGKSFKELLEPFPQSVKDAIAKGEAADRKGWWDAMMVFYAQHGCRVQPFPEEFLTTFGYSHGANADQIRVVCRSFTKEWSIVDRVHGIDVYQEDSGRKVGQVRGVEPYAIPGGEGEVHGDGGGIPRRMREGRGGAWTPEALPALWHALC